MKENIESKLEKLKKGLKKSHERFPPPRESMSPAQRKLHNLEFGILMTALTIGGGWGAYELFTNNSPQKPGTQLEERIDQNESYKTNKDFKEQNANLSKESENRISVSERTRIKKKAFEYLSDGEYLSAYNLLKPVVEQYPDNAGLLNSFGVSLEGQGKYDDAIQTYRKAIKLKPKFPEALNNLGYTYFKKGNPTEARKWFDKTLENDLNFTKAMVNIGYLYLEEDKMALAINWYNKAIAVDDNQYYAWYNKSLAQSKLGNFRDAKKSVDKALKIRPESEYASIQKRYLDKLLAK